jgi:protein-S-isoprenylcysteine O-methyltransferase Ste14
MIQYNLENFIHTPAGIYSLIINAIVGLCVMAILVSVLIDFTEFQKRTGTKREKRSIVETGTMFLFFFLFYILIRFKAGQINLHFSILSIIPVVFGLMLMIVGCIVNIKGRLDLGKNWSNQIKIYKDHTLATHGMYQLVRHPLYASLIWMFFGASLVYLNYLALLANLTIFIPFMYYRAKQEEFLLAKEFANYKKYQSAVGMFFPKIFKLKK